MRILSVGLLAFLYLTPVFGARAAVELVPHRALYEMTLLEASPRSGITGARGAMMYRFEDSCDAWTSETKVILKIDYSEGERVQTTWAFASWEAKDGLSYRFNVRHSRNGNTVEILEGKVRRDGIDGPSIAEFSSPENTEIELPEGTMFPTQHLIALIDAGLENKLTISEVVFDGASLENPYRINALITKPGTTKVKTRASRHVRMAFFPVLGKSEQPEFELGITYRTDGVAERIRQDFGDFSLDLLPNSIEVLDKPDC